MPQFDKVTFFNQIFWLFFFFSGFYLTLLTTFLPKISSALKARTKKLQKGTEGLVSFSKEQSALTNLFDSFLEKTCSASKASLSRYSEYFCVGASSTLPFPMFSFKESSITVRNFMEKALQQKSILFLVAKNFKV
jgi:hypothetical protein